MNRGRGKAIAVLVVGAATLFVGAIFVFLPITPILITVGVFLMMAGAVTIMLPLGLFSGTPYHGRGGRVLNRAERDRKKRERKRYSD